jgi:hypothetical protein
MQTLSKQQVSNWILLDYNAQKQIFQEKILFLERKYATDFISFEQKIEQVTTESFEAWDDYIEWKAYRQIVQS